MIISKSLTDDKKIYFPILAVSFVVMAFIMQHLLNIDKVLYQTLSNQLSTVQIDELVEVQKKWQWISYCIIPIVLLIKVSLISFFLYLGSFFFNKNITFKRLWSIAVKAEFIFLLVGFSKIIWFYFFQTNYTLEDIQYFYPLSALNIIGYEGLAPWFIYPFQMVNLFELAYWFVLAYLLGKELKTNTDEGFKIVASSYGPALLIWVVTVMFFTLNVS